MSPGSRNTDHKVPPSIPLTLSPGVHIYADEPFVRGFKQKMLVMETIKANRRPETTNQSTPVQYTFFDEEQHDVWTGIKSTLRITKAKCKHRHLAPNESQSLVVSGNFGNFYVGDDTMGALINNNVSPTRELVNAQKVVTSPGETHGTFTLKVLVIGDPCAGKTSMINRYVHGQFERDYKATLGVDFALKVVRWSDNVTMKLQLWDIAGQERFTSMTRVYYKDAHACVIMFDLTQRGSFLNALKWKRDLDQKVALSDGNPVPCILLANKCDLADREVDQTEIEAFCQNQEFIGWTETSVKEGLMVEESMRFLLDDMIARYAERNPGMTDSQALDLDRRSNVYLRRASNLGLRENCAC